MMWTLHACLAEAGACEIGRIIFCVLPEVADSYWSGRMVMYGSVLLGCCLLELQRTAVQQEICSGLKTSSASCQRWLTAIQPQQQICWGSI